VQVNGTITVWVAASTFEKNAWVKDITSVMEALPATAPEDNLVTSSKQ
jgi:hypothetical protein